LAVAFRADEIFGQQFAFRAVIPRVGGFFGKNVGDMID
jgi:hypothetical protein